MKFYKYECTDCKQTTIETNNNAGGILTPGAVCPRCKSATFELIGER
jgi:Zn finger protein HypA/HybF involved in hydrogenase expression